MAPRAMVPSYVAQVVFMARRKQATKAKLFISS